MNSATDLALLVWRSNIRKIPHLIPTSFISQQLDNSSKFVSLRPENNSLLNVRNRFCFNRGKSLKQSEEICEIAFWQKIRKTWQAHFKSPGPCVYERFSQQPPPPKKKGRGGKDIMYIVMNVRRTGSERAGPEILNCLSPSNSSRFVLTN
jgi:hypothetical protein